jgi:hypothetical protein
MMRPKWSEVFPRLYELFSESCQSNEANYFKAFDKTLKMPLAQSDYKLLEGEISQLDNVAWQEFKLKALNYITTRPSSRGYNQLFECFNEIKGYLYLKAERCRNIHFIPEDSVTSPDLKACFGDSMVLLEVKTINKSSAEIEWILANSQIGGNRKAMESIQGLSNSLKNKITYKINQAKLQLLDYPSVGVKRRIVFLVINLDRLYALVPRNYDDLAVYIQTQSNTQIEVQYSCVNLHR